MKKKLLAVVNSIDTRMKKNTLSEDASAMWEEVRAAFEALAEDDAEHTIEELKNRFDEIAAKFAEADEKVAERIQAVRNELMAQMTPATKNVADKFTAEVRKDICNAITRAQNDREAVANVMEVAKKNDITGLSFANIVDYTLNVKQEDNDELYNELAQVVYNQFFVADLDEEDADHIAKQWNGLGVEVTEKDIQELAAEGKTIATKNIYKRQRVANEVIDDVQEAGQEAEFVSSITSELRRAVQGLIVRAALIGDKVNAAGKKVTTFETIGTAKTSTMFTRVIAPATPGRVDLLDIRKAADAVKYDYKIAVMSSDTKLALIDRRYATGGTPILLSDEELAAQLGVNKVYTRDFIDDETGLHAIVFNPREYWVKSKKEREIAFPQYEKNVLNYLYENNCGGAIHGLQSCAVVREASGSSKASK